MLERTWASSEKGDCRSFMGVVTQQVCCIQPSHGTVMYPVSLRVRILRRRRTCAFCREVGGLPYLRAAVPVLAFPVEEKP